MNWFNEVSFVSCRAKENVKNSGGARLNSNFELFTVGFYSANG
jgi:hypothetical protein